MLKSRLNCNYVWAVTLLKYPKAWWDKNPQKTYKISLQKILLARLNCVFLFLIISIATPWKKEKKKKKLFCTVVPTSLCLDIRNVEIGQNTVSFFCGLWTFFNRHFHGQRGINVSWNKQPLCTTAWLALVDLHVFLKITRSVACLSCFDERPSTRIFSVQVH